MSSALNSLCSMFHINSTLSKQNVTFELSYKRDDPTHTSNTFPFRSFTTANANEPLCFNNCYIAVANFIVRFVLFCSLAEREREREGESEEKNNNKV